MNDEQNIIIYNSADGKAKVALYAKDGNIWLNQNQLAEFYPFLQIKISALSR